MGSLHKTLFIRTPLIIPLLITCERFVINVRMQPFSGGCTLVTHMNMQIRQNCIDHDLTLRRGHAIETFIVGILLHSRSVFAPVLKIITLWICWTVVYGTTCQNLLGKKLLPPIISFCRTPGCVLGTPLFSGFVDPVARQ